ncbi:uncharacterized protein MYCFIDRAFT_175088 [Pseudocercospora fijiensis CIRAD86]|uniref:Uncharacterized protein n=1 Tax=Pseudocercospora fijiensis (strain CIRAD86) TaxID=383855 RepID=M3AGF5_PSEFD|nr:uncharacterized protein MYCFIDRAFT_175088 [Pseudocercospora fijiensis CIRAD86]EME83661.1 hypothetical protein MYCFIDRAFT_175088 [Pseudocercospora fijiensis CIRAD86]
MNELCGVKKCMDRPSFGENGHSEAFYAMASAIEKESERYFGTKLTCKKSTISSLEHTGAEATDTRPRHVISTFKVEASKEAVSLGRPSRGNRYSTEAPYKHVQGRSVEGRASKAFVYITSTKGRNAEEDTHSQGYLCIRSLGLSERERDVGAILPVLFRHFIDCILETTATFSFHPHGIGRENRGGMRCFLSQSAFGRGWREIEEALGIDDGLLTAALLRGYA